jgi:CBS domain-containing protein
MVKSKTIKKNKKKWNERKKITTSIEDSKINQDKSRDSSIELILFEPEQKAEPEQNQHDPYSLEQARQAYAENEPPAEKNEPKADIKEAREHSTEEWEHTKSALRKRYAGYDSGEVESKPRQDPHEVVAAIMKRIQDSRQGENKNLHNQVPQKEIPASQDGILRMSDVMSTDVTCVLGSTTLEQLAGLFNKRHIMAAPVVDYQTQKYLGLVSMSDIFSDTFSEKLLSTVENGTLVDEDFMDVLDQPIRDFMKAVEYVAVPPDCTVQEACELMVNNNLHHLVIVYNHLVRGIFSAFDALRILAKPQEKKETK